MLKSSKGEMSVGVISGLVLLVVIIIGLIVWSQKNKTVDMNEDTMVPLTTETSATPSVSGSVTGTSEVSPITNPPTTIETNPVNPTLPKTGFGPEGK